MLVVILQARMSSKRLPGKVLEPVLGKPMIIRQLERVTRAQLDSVCVATSDMPEDDPIDSTVRDAGVGCFRGSLADVLDRYYRAASQLSASHVVRVTGDCPLIDPRVIDQVTQCHFRERNDYTSNTLQRTYPDGMDVEVMRIEALEQAWTEADGEAEREHVTPYIRDHPQRFKLGSVLHDEDLSRLRWTVDFPEDLALIRRVFETLYPENAEFSMQDIRALFERQPELARMNAQVRPGLGAVS